MSGKLDPGSPSAGIAWPSIKPAPLITPLDGAAPNPGVASVAIRQDGPAYVAPTHATELPALRAEHSDVVANPNGTFSLQTSSQRLNFRDAQGSWQPIDLTLVAETSGAYGLRVKANDRTVRFSSVDAAAALAQLQMGAYSIGLRAPGYSSGTVTNGELQFAAGDSNGTVFARPTDVGLEWGATLRNALQPSVLTFALDTGGLTAHLADDGQTVLLDDPQSAPGGDPTKLPTVGSVTAPELIDGTGATASAGEVHVDVLSPGATPLPAGVDPDAVTGLSATEVLLVYSIDAAWLADPARTFPVVLDPSACIGGQAAGCDINQASGSFETFVASGGTQSGTVMRTGFDSRPDDGGSFGTLRSLWYFPDVVLPDGAEVTTASVRLQAGVVAGSPVGHVTHMYRITDPWSTASTWSQIAGKYDSASASTAVSVPSGVAAGTNMTWDVTTAARQLYTRRGLDWKPDVGFLLRFDTESGGEVDFRMHDSTWNSTSAPLFTLNYVIPKVTMDFDASLGANYAPSLMIVGQATKLAVSVTNNASGFTFLATGTDHYELGYRWFDQKGVVVGSASQALTASIASGATSALQTLIVTPPTTPGTYTLRLELVHIVGSSTVWASDWARPSLFYSRDKRTTDTDNTRWTGSSAIEREEFQISVTDGSGTNNGDTADVDLGPDGTASVNLNGGNLHYRGDTGLGFDDLIPAELTYGYDRARANACNSAAYNGILGACGWNLNYDERVTATGTDGYTYQDPGGDTYFVSTDAEGQLLSSAPVLISRPRITFVDENGSGDIGGSGTPAVPAALASTYSIPAYSGNYVLPMNSAASLGIPGMPTVDLTDYRYASFAVRTTGATGVGIDFKIRNLTNPAYGDRWFVYTVGTNFTSGFDQVALGGSVNGIWDAINRRDLYSDLMNNGNFGAYGDDLQVIAFDMTSNGQSGTTFFDAVRFESYHTGALDETNPSWTANGAGTTTSTDRMSGAVSVKVPSSALASSPTCNPSNGCVYGTQFVDNPFISWYWKKAAGASVALQLGIKDLRTSTTKYLTYYAGTQPSGVTSNCGATGTQPCAIQVDDAVPAEWKHVTRNVLEDARQLMGFFLDNPTGSDASAPPSQGPVGDNLQLTQYVASGVDGSYALFDAISLTSLPDKGTDEYAHPSSQGDATFTYDYVVTEPDGSKHFFNRDGLLERVADVDGNQLNLDWTLSTTKVGPLAYTLTTVHAPGDGSSLTSGTAQRDIAVSTTTPTGFRQVTFTEQLGSTASHPGRRADFYVATATGTTYGVGDLVKVSEARLNLSSCPTSRPTGCLEFNYTATTGHTVAEIRDPRWDGSSGGSADYRFSVAYDTASPYFPTAITDNSHAGAALVQLVSYDTGAGGGYARVAYQDADARASNAAITEDLNPDGGLRIAYARKACSGTCNWGTGAPSVAASEIAEQRQFDGLSRVNQILRYRCPASASLIAGCTGSTALITMSRQSTQADAKIDNFNDPLRAGETAWSQTPDQYLASLTAGNVDLYRTTYTYDDHHRPTHVVSPTYNRQGSVVNHDLHTTYDAEGHPTAIDDNTFVLNPGFENGLNGGWSTYSGTAVLDTSSPHSGSNAVKVFNAGSASDHYQGIQLLPGQTFRLQLWAKAASGSTATVAVIYQKRSDLNFATVPGSPLSTTATSWTDLAADFTIPAGDATGLIHIDLTSAANQTAWYDDVSLFSTFEARAYQTNGLLTDQYTLNGVNATGTTDMRTGYAATSTNPAIFPTSATANYVDGAFDASKPDEDVLTSTTFDTWGRSVAVSDPDAGVGASSTTYAANMTDVASTTDGAADTTSYTYDLVGNPLTTTQPAGEVTSVTYDLLNHPLLTTAPDGTKALNAYDNFGHLSTGTDNYVDGSPSGSGGADDLMTSYAYDAWGNTTTTISDDGAFGGAIKQKTTAAFDLLGNPVASTTYADTGYTQARTTTSFWDTVVSGSTYTRAKSSGSQQPIAPAASPAPLCPGTASSRCNSVAALDFNAGTISVTDGYGKLTQTDRDMANHIVQSVANYVDGVYDPAATDTDVITRTIYDVLGRPAQQIDAAGRKTVTTFDALGRATEVDNYDSAGAAVSKRRTVFTAAGRVDRASDLAAYATSDSGLTWTKTEYDAAGRAIRTLQHYDSAGNFHRRLDSFEGGSAGWSGTASGYFTTNPSASMGLDDAFAPIGPKSGRGRLHITTSAGSATDGAWLNLSGQTFQSGRTYHLHADLLATSGTSLTVLLGVDQSGASNAQVAVSATGAWQTVDLDWAPGAATGTNVHAAVRKDSTGTADVYLDNMQVYDLTEPDFNIPSETAYDPDGRTVASVLPPGTNGGAPMVTTTLYDPAARVVAVSANATDVYSHRIASDGQTDGLVAYWPLDERTGSSAADHKGASPLTDAGSVALGVSGGPDEARAAAAFDGSSGYASRSTNVTSAIDNFSLEAWFRVDGAGTSRVIALNGVAGAGWGIGVDSAGHVAGLYSGGTDTWLSTGIAPVIGTWHHVVLVRSAGTASIYYDGTAYTPTNAGLAPPTPGAGFSVGRLSSASGGYWNGAIDEVAAYTTAVSSSVLTGHFSAGSEPAADARLTTRSSYDPLGRQTSQTSPRGIRDVYRYDRLGRVTTSIGNYRDGVASGPPQTGSLDLTVPGSLSDMYTYEDGGSGSYSRTSTHVFAADSSSTTYDYRSGLRFSGVSVPAGAIITNAYLTLTSDATPSVIPATTIHGEAADSAADYTSDTHNTFIARARTSASVSWTPSAWTSGTAYQSPNLASVVQEIVGRTGWTSGNALALFWEAADGSWGGTNNRLSAYSYDGSAANAAKLHIDYTLAQTGGDDDVTTTFAYDALGEQIGMCSANQVFATGCDPANAANAQAWHETYDAMGHLASQVAPVNTATTALASTSWTYDFGGRLTTTCDFSAGGSCTTSTDRHTDYTYDALGRSLTEKTYAGSGTGTLKLSTTDAYTVDGDVASAAFDGTGSSEGTDTLTYTYDLLGRPDQLKRGSTVLSDANWNADGSLASRVDGDAGVLGTATFGYDWAKRMTSVSDPTLVSGSLTQSWGLDGLLAGRTWPNSEGASFSYDGAKRPITATYASAGSFSQAYDRDGNVTSEARTLSGVSGNAGSGTLAYSYDGLNRLVGSSGVGGTRAYSYDLDGNRLSRSEPSLYAGYRYDRSDALISETLAGHSATVFNYDPYGNLTQAATSVASLTAYAYDLGDRLTGITPAIGSSAAFSLDAAGRFKTRSVGSAVDTYSYLGSSETVVGISTSGVMTASLLDPSGARLENKNTSSGAAAFSLPDLHGSLAAAELTGSTTLSDAFRYDGYGQTIATGGAGSGPAQPYRYQSRLDVSPDSSEPLYDFGARFYTPSAGVFTQLDSTAGSAQDPLSLNRYLYAEANPTTLVDPDGHMAITGDNQWDSYRAYATVSPSGKRTLHVIPPPKHAVAKPKPASKPLPKSAPTHWLGKTRLLSGLDKARTDSGKKADPGLVRTITVLSLTIGGDLVARTNQQFGNEVVQDFQGLAARGGILGRLGAAGEGIGNGLIKFGRAAGGAAVALGGVYSGLEVGSQHPEEPTWQRVLHGVTKAITNASGTIAIGALGAAACAPSTVGALACGAGGAYAGSQGGDWIGDRLISGEDWLIKAVTTPSVAQPPNFFEGMFLDPTDLLQVGG